MANYYVGTATLDLTQSDMDITRNWFCNNIVVVTTLTPASNAVPVWFCAASTIPPGISVSGVSYTALMPEGLQITQVPIEQETI